MSQEWDYAVAGDRQGPVAAADLKKMADAGKLKPEDLVWKDGMADWAPARSIKGLFGAAAAAAAPAGRSGEQKAARVREAEPVDDDRPSARGRRRDEEDDRPSRRGRDEEDDERPSARVRRRDDEDDDRPSRRGRA